jgi:hypothetical protein
MVNQDFNITFIKEDNMKNTVDCLCSIKEIPMKGIILNNGNTLNLGDNGQEEIILALPEIKENRMKYNEGKPNYGYLYTSMMNQVAKVREYGVKKHGSIDGWQSTKQIQHLESAERHIRAVMDGEWTDESGFSHLAHAICNLMFEVERMAQGLPDPEKRATYKQKTKPITDNMSRRNT